MTTKNIWGIENTSQSITTKNIVISSNATVMDDIVVDGGTLKVNADTNKVGIGTLNPETELDVEGDIQCNSLISKTIDTDEITVDGDIIAVNLECSLIEAPKIKTDYIEVNGNHHIEQGILTIDNKGQGDYLTFQGDRAWRFTEKGQDGSSGLHLNCDTSYKSFNIGHKDGDIPCMEVQVSSEIENCKIEVNGEANLNNNLSMKSIAPTIYITDTKGYVEDGDIIGEVVFTSSDVSADETNSIGLFRCLSAPGSGAIPDGLFSFDLTGQTGNTTNTSAFTMDHTGNFKAPTSITIGDTTLTEEQLKVLVASVKLG